MFQMTLIEMIQYRSDFKFNTENFYKLNLKNGVQCNCLINHNDDCFVMVLVMNLLLRRSACAKLSVKSLERIFML